MGYDTIGGSADPSISGESGDLASSTISSLWTEDSVVQSAPAWLSTDDVFCTHISEDVDNVAVWAMPGGLRVLVSSSSHQVLMAQDGAGWEEDQLPGASLMYRIAGFGPAARVFRFGAQPAGCALEWLDPAVTCAAGIPRVIDALGHESGLAGHAVSSDAIYHFDGDLWTLGASSPESINAVWGDTERVVVATDGGIWSAPLGEELSPVSDGVAFESVWVTSEGTVFAIDTSSRILHLDSGEATIVLDRRAGCHGVTTLRGAGDHVFFYGPRTFGTIVDGQARVIAEEPCDGNAEITDVWAARPDEVYLGIVDASSRGEACGGARLAWFDGHELANL